MLNIKAIARLRLLSRHDTIAGIYSIYNRPAYKKLGSLFESKPRDANILITISKKYNCAYFGVPKAASSVIKKTLYRLVSDGSARSMKKVKRASAAFNHSRKLDYYLYSDEVFRFSVVRNPYTRALSCYLDKICNESRTQFLGLGIKNYFRDRPLSFLEFLLLIREQKPHEMDIHWRPQVNLVQPDKINYGIIGRVETLNQDMAEVLSRIGAKGEVAARKSGRSSRRADGNMAKYLGPEERDIIREIYAEDFRVFGYSHELPHSERGTASQGPDL